MKFVLRARPKITTHFLLGPLRQLLVGRPPVCASGKLFVLPPRSAAKSSGTKERALIFGRALSLAMVLAFQSATAHEGHHGPESKMAPKGGKLENSTDLSFELFKDESGVRIYSYTHESLESDKKPLSPANIKVETQKTLLTNSKKKSVEFQLEPEADFLKLTFKKGGSYYDLKLVVSYMGKEQKSVKWRFEP